MNLNAYHMMSDIRDSLNESTASHWTDLAILRKLNKAQRKLAMHMSMSIGDWFLTKTNITASNALITLPADCSKPVYLEDSTTGTELPFSLTVRERRVTRITGVDIDQLEPDVYLYGSYVEVNQASYAGTVTLWYEKRVPDLHFGTASAGGATTLTFLSTNFPVRIDDYYNGSYIEAVSGTGAGTRTTISDYTGSTGAATTAAGTFGNDTVYGTVSALPEEAIPVMTQLATVELLSKPSAAIDPKYFEFHKIELKDAMSLFNDWISTRVKNSQRIRPQEDWT